jgi:hypothetical protein
MGGGLAIGAQLELEQRACREGSAARDEHPAATDVARGLLDELVDGCALEAHAHRRNLRALVFPVLGHQVCSCSRHLEGPGSGRSHEMPRDVATASIV